MSQFVEVTDQFDEVDIDPQQAATTIKEAIDLGTDVANYSANKDFYSQDLKDLKTPEKLHPKLAEFAGFSKEQSALVYGDADTLNKYGKAWDDLKDGYSRAPKMQRLTDLTIKKMTDPDNYTDLDDSERIGLNLELNSSGIEGKDIDLLDTVVSETGTQVGLLKGMIERNHAKIIEAGTATAALTAAASIPVPVPGITVVAAKGGFFAGAGTAATVLFGVENIKLNTALTYNAIEDIEVENDQVIDESTKTQISAGAGLVMGVVETAIGRVAAKGIPGLRNFVGSKEFVKRLVNDPSKAALKTTLMEFGKIVGVQGVGEGTQEVVQVLAEELGKADGSWTEAQFTTALMNAKERIGQATVVGGATAGVIQAPFSGINYITNKANMIETGSVEAQRMQTSQDFKGVDSVEAIRGELNKAKRALEFQNRIATIGALQQASQTEKISPEGMRQIVQNFVEESDLRYLTMNLDDLEALNLSQDKYNKVKQIFKLDDVIFTEAPALVSTIDFFESAKIAPELYDIIRENEDSSSAAQATKFLERVQEADKRATELQKKLSESGKKMTQEEVNEYYNKILNRGEQFDGEQYIDVTDDDSYVNSKVVPDDVKKGLAEGEYKRIESARKEARKKRINTIETKLDEDYRKIKDNTEIDKIELQKEEEFEALVNHPGLELAAKFDPSVEATNVFVGKRVVDNLKETHQKKGFSAYAIDPNTLSKDQRSKFLRNKNLTKHKVFVGGGLPLEEAARLLGFNNGEALLTKLSTVPTRKELADAKAERHREKIRGQIEETVKPDDQEIAERYNDVSKNHLEELRFMLDQKWSAAKTEITRLVKGIPTIPEIDYEAKRAILGTTIRKLTPKMFEVAERKADAKAVNYWTKGDLYNAFDQKMNAAKAVLLDKHLKAYTKKLNREIRYLRKIQKDPEVTQILKRAGPLYYDAVTYLMGSVNMRPDSAKQVAKRESFYKFAERMSKEGNGDFTVPDAFNDVRKNVKDFTVEEILQISELVHKIVAQADMKDIKIANRNASQLVDYIEDVGNNVEKRLSGLTQFDLEKLKESQLDSKTASILKGTPILLKRMEFVFQRLDRGEVNGYMHRTFFQPLVDAGNNKAQDVEAVFNKMQELIKAYGEKEFQYLNTEVFNVPELANAKGLNGKVTKAQLIQIAQNMGNEGNIKVVENFNIDPQTMWQVLDRHLTTKDMDYVQGVWDLIESLRPKVAELEMKINRIEPEWVEAKPFKFKGKVYRGGYYRIMYHGETNFEMTQDMLIGAGERATLEQMVQKKQYAQAMTKQNHLKTRTEGGKKTLDLSLSNTNQVIEEILHDIHYRIPVRDVARLLADEKIANNISAATSVEQYNAIAQWVVNAANSNLEPTTNKFERMVMKVLNYVSGAQNIVYLGARLSVALTQTVSLPGALLKMGPSGAKYMGQVLASFSGNPTQMKATFDYVADRFPDFKLSLQNLDLSARHSFDKFMPSDRTGKVSAFIDIQSRINKERTFMLIAHMDMFVRGVTWQSAYLQALNGEAKGVIAGDEQAAINYASSVTRTTQTANNAIDKAPIQQINWFNNLFGKFYSQLSIVHNLIDDGWQDFKDARIQSAEIFDTFGGSAEAVRAAFKTEAKGIGSLALHIYLAGILPSVLINMIKGEPLPGDGENEEKWGEYLFKEGMKSWMSTIPVVREASWYMFSNRKYGQQAGIPLTRTITDFAESGKTMLKLAEAYRKGQSPEEMSDKQVRSLMNSIGIVVGGAPTEAMYSIFKEFQDIDINKLTRNDYAKTALDISKFLKSDTTNVPEPLVEALQETLQALDPQLANEVAAQNEAESNGLDESYYDVIKQIESGGDKFAKNPKSSAAGLYQFTEGTWNWIMESAPELELTSRGRYNVDTSQQEKAIRWFTDFNINQLKAAEIEITPENVYAAHFLGASGAIKVLSAPEGQKLSTLVSGDVTEANPQLQSSWKVRDFKQWLTEKIESNKPLTENENN